MDNKIKYIDLNGLKIFAEALKQDLKNHVLELGLYQELLHRIENLELYKIVDSLPEIGDEDTIYLLKNPSGSGDKNVFIEYLYNNEHGWEEIGNFTPSFDLEDYVKVEDAPFEKGSAENSAVLKGGDNQAISEGGVALGKNNIVGLKGWYYKAMSMSNTGYVYLYLSSEQQLPSFVSSVNEVEQENDIVCDLKEGDVCCIINGNRFINVFKVKYNHIKRYGRIGFSYIGEGDNPIDGIITTEEINKGNLSLDDYCVYCLNKPDIGNVNISESALAEGKLTKSLNSYTHAEGLRSAAYGKTSHVEGQDNIASGECSHAEGAYTKSTGDASHAEGFNTEASELSAHAEGYRTLASNGASHAEGSATKATGLHSHAEGDTTIAKGNNSHAEGSSTKAEGDYSHAEGYGTTAKGYCSHAEGFITTATGSNSHAEGYGTTVKGYCSHAEGENTIAEGKRSHAEGNTTKAIGGNTHTEGLGTIAYNSNEHASGKYNKSTQSSDISKATQFSIGIGTSDTDRKNAFEVRQNGDVYIARVEKPIQTELTELSAEVSGLSERVEELGEGGSSVFEAVYGVTTYDEIVEAVKSKKHIICFYNDRVYNLTNYKEGQDLFFTCALSAIYFARCGIGNDWTIGQYNYEISANKVNTINASSTDLKYPSAKAVYDAIQQSGTLVSDWNAKEGEPGYIKNKPFYNNVDCVINKSGEYNNVYEKSSVIFNNKTLFNLEDIAYDDVIVINSGPPVTLEKRYENDGTITLIIEDVSNYLSAYPIIIGNLVTIPEIFIPDTIARKSDIVVDPIVWKYICNPLIIEEGISIPDELYDKDRDWLKYEYPAMYRFYDGMEYKFCVKADYDRLTDSKDQNWYMHGQTFCLE